MNDITEGVVVERGRFGRILTARIRPNVDLVEGIEAICAENDIACAEIRSCANYYFTIRELGVCGFPSSSWSSSSSSIHLLIQRRASFGFSKLFKILALI